MQDFICYDITSRPMQSLSHGLSLIFIIVIMLRP